MYIKALGHYQLIKTAFLFVLTIILLVACNSQPNLPLYQTIATPAIDKNVPIKQPSGKVVLIVSGRIGVSNTAGKREVQFDMPTLESLGVVEYRVNDTQALRREVTFQGILMSTLLEAVQSDPTAKVAFVSALDDYSIEIPLQDFREWPVMLATRQENTFFDLGQFGPTRIVYPNMAFSFEKTTYDPRWIWSVGTIDIR